MPTINCPHCGTSNRTGSKFCNECGAILDVPVEETFDPVAGADESMADDVPDWERDPWIDEDGIQIDADGPKIDTPATGLSGAPDKLQGSEPSFPPPTPRRRPPRRPVRPAPPPADQPWLHPARDDADAATAPQSQTRSDTARLFAGLQGLLDPVDVADEIPPLAALPPTQPTTAPVLDDATRRHLRTLAGSGLHLADPLPPPARPRPVAHRPARLIALLIGLALGLPVLLLATSPDINPHLWPGVKQAIKAIDSLEPGSVVLVNWAYDPATAGEMDLVAQPILYHLLAQRAQLVVVSQLPTGPATARRIVAQVTAELSNREGIFLPLSGPQSVVTSGGFFPGGPGVLPLLGQDVAETVGSATLPDPTGLATARSITRLQAQGSPDLSVVIAAQAEDVQEWLEQVQPLDNTPVLAVVSAGADPILRPYLDSAQLVGLVSGYDGGYNYANLVPGLPSPQVDMRLQVQAVAQDWGLWMILAIILAGNLRNLFGYGEPGPGRDD